MSREMVDAKDKEVMMKKAFTILELAVVILIIAILLSIATINVRLVENTQIKKTLAIIEQYGAAAEEFYNIYAALPGDMPNATSLLPAPPTGSTNNGDGDNIIDSASQAIGFFHHLYLANFTLYPLQ